MTEDRKNFNDDGTAKAKGIAVFEDNPEEIFVLMDAFPAVIRKVINNANVKIAIRPTYDLWVKVQKEYNATPLQFALWLQKTSQKMADDIDPTKQKDSDNAEDAR